MVAVFVVVIWIAQQGGVLRRLGRCNPRVPCRNDGTSFETPKSASFALPSRVRRMFPALTSYGTNRKGSRKGKQKTKKRQMLLHKQYIYCSGVSNRGTTAVHMEPTEVEEASTVRSRLPVRISPHPVQFPVAVQVVQGENCPCSALSRLWL